MRNAQSQWTNNVNWCGIQDQASPPAHYEGKTSRAAKQDGYSTVDWGGLKNDQNCSGALACTVIAYDEQGNPAEADVRFNSEFFEWSTTVHARDAYDIQSVAAHEIGHVIQFDHVTNSSKRDHTVVMWPVPRHRRHLRPQASAAATRSGTTATTDVRAVAPLLRRSMLAAARRLT